jgi:hypothetical protein
MKKILALASIGLLASGCYTIRYTTSAPPSGYAPEQWSNTFVNGIINVSAPVNVSALCPHGFAVVENQVTFLNLVLSAIAEGALYGAFHYATGQRLDPRLTAGPFSVGLELWTPSTVRVLCASGGSPVGPPAPAPFTPPPPPGR